MRAWVAAGAVSMSAVHTKCQSFGAGQQTGRVRSGPLTVWYVCGLRQSEPWTGDDPSRSLNTGARNASVGDQDEKQK